MMDTIFPDAALPQRPAIGSSKSMKEMPGATLSCDSGSDQAIGEVDSKGDVPDHKSSASAVGAGQWKSDVPSDNAGTENISDGHEWHETHVVGAVAGDQGAHYRGGTQPPPSPLIAEIVALAAMRRRWHKAEKSLQLQGRAMARSWTDGNKDEANRLFDLAAAGLATDPTLTIALAPFLAAKAHFENERKAIEKTLRKLSRNLPVCPWVDSVKGLGDLRLAIIVGECGDIAAYRNPSCLWKRMGLAVIDGGRQRRVSDAADALAHGYNPERRAVAYVMATEIIKAQVRNVKDDDGKRTDESRAIGHYGQVYLDRKQYEIGREGVTKAHANNRAARYMVKRVLRDLYTAWRAA